MADRFEDASMDAAVDAKQLVSIDLVRVSLGCTDSQYTDQATCELNDGIWTDDILLATHDADITALVVINEVEVSKTFLATKNLTGISDIEEAMAIDLASVTLEFSGISGEWLKLAQQANMLNRPVEVWKVLLDFNNDYAIIGKPFKTYAGTIVGGGGSKAVEGGGSAVEIEVSNPLHNFQRLSGFRCTVADHQKFFPEDTGMQHTSSLERELRW